jgi:nucleotide-binding universal stress UspA family protein
MFQRILVPLDGSSRAERALPDYHHEESIEHVKQTMYETVESLHDEFKAVPAGGLTPQITWSVVVNADVAHALTRIAESGGEVEGAGAFGRCDIIALSTHGHSDLRRWAIGSTTDRVLKATKLPMLIVRPKQLQISIPEHSERKLDGQQQEHMHRSAVLG